MKTSEFVEKVIEVWLDGSYSSYMCDCASKAASDIFNKDRSIEGFLLEESFQDLIIGEGMNGFKLRNKIEDYEELMNFRYLFLLNAVEYFKSIND